MIKKEKMLVLGGAGLIGSYLVEKLVEKKYEIMVIDDFSKGQMKNLKKFKNKIKIKKINLETSSELKNSNILNSTNQINQYYSNNAS